MRVGIAYAQAGDDHELWEIACQERGIEYFKFNILDSDWLSAIDSKIDLVLLRPPSVSWRLKNAYDERVHVLNKYLKVPIYPDIDEVILYENKRMLSYWLAANGIPHPETLVFYDNPSIDRVISRLGLPVVAKTTTGAAGRGVEVLRSESELLRYCSRAFGSSGIAQRWTPNLATGRLVTRAFRAFGSRRSARETIRRLQSRRHEITHGIVIFQEFIDHEYEWRIVRIGDSFFGHKKLAKAGMASGSKLKEYGAPSESALDFVFHISEKYGIKSAAFDLFETERGLLVNEIQTIFGQSDAFQMKINGVIGRYIRQSKEWCFEPGDYARLKCYPLRLDDAILRIRGNA